MESIHFLFNAEYDFALRSESIKPHIKLATESMEPLFAPVFSGRDRIISSCVITPDFNEYLDTLGIDNARLTTPTKSKGNERGEAWGWSEKVIGRLKEQGYSVTHPSPECCRDVNSRVFCSYVSDKYSVGVQYSTLVNRCEELTNFLDETPYDQFVAKPLFGNAGAGFIFFSKDEREQVEQLIKNEPVILEPWLTRSSDIASLFEVKRDGSVHVIGHHRNLCNRSGAFYGTLILHNDPIISKYLDRIETMIESVAFELHQKGYFGIVSIDSFCYSEDGEEKIALGIDINCRYTMSYIAHKTDQKLKKPALLYRFLARKRHRLPENIADFIKLLGPLAYSPERKSGVIAMSPMRIEGSDRVIRQPLRSAFAVVGESEEEVMGIDNEFLKIMSGTKR